MEITLQTEFTIPDLPVNRDFDTFTRSNADIAGVTEGAGLPWVIEGPNASLWRAGIRENQLSVWRSEQLTAGSERVFCVVDTGKRDGEFQMRLNSVPSGAPSGNATFVFRYVNPQNYLWVYANTTDGTWSLYKVVNGVAEKLATGEIAASSGLISVRTNGRTIVVYHNGVPTVRRLEYGGFVNATKYGVAVRAVAGNNMSTVRFDDFAMFDLT